jgi:hypothetical protein
MSRSFRRRSRQLAHGPMVTVQRRWGTDDHGTLGIDIRQRSGYTAEIWAYVTAQEARQLSNDLADLADHLEGQVEG